MVFIQFQSVVLLHCCWYEFELCNPTYYCCITLYVYKLKIKRLEMWYEDELSEVSLFSLHLYFSPQLTLLALLSICEKLSSNIWLMWTSLLVKFTLPHPHSSFTSWFPVLFFVRLLLILSLSFFHCLFQWWKIEIAKIQNKTKKLSYHCCSALGILFYLSPPSPLPSAAFSGWMLQLIYNIRAGIFLLFSFFKRKKYNIKLCSVFFFFSVL